MQMHRPKFCRQRHEMRKPSNAGVCRGAAHTVERARTSKQETCEQRKEGRVAPDDQTDILNYMSKLFLSKFD